MTNIHDFSGRVIDYAERLSDMADAAQGQGSRRAGTGTRRLILPAAGAGLFALVRSDFFTRQAKEVVEQAKTRASDLPDELLSQVRQTSQKPSRNGSQGSAHFHCPPHKCFAAEDESVEQCRRRPLDQDEIEP
jgi:hypothetical protein